MSRTAPFRAGIDFALDLADSMGGMVTSMLVADQAPGVVDLHVTIVKRRELPLNHIKLNFEAIRTIEPCLAANPNNHTADPTPEATT